MKKINRLSILFYLILLCQVYAVNLPYSIKKIRVPTGHLNQYNSADHFNVNLLDENNLVYLPLSITSKNVNLPGALLLNTDNMSIRTLESPVNDLSTQLVGITGKYWILESNVLNDYDLWVLDITTGTIAWKLRYEAVKQPFRGYKYKDQNINSFKGKSYFYNGKIYTLLVDEIICHSLKNGEREWSTPVGNPGYFTMDGNGANLLVMTDTSLFSFNIARQSKSWEISIPTIRLSGVIQPLKLLINTPDKIIVGYTVYAGPEKMESYLVSLQPGTGKILWKLRFFGFYHMQDYQVAGNILYLALGKQRKLFFINNSYTDVFAISMVNGKILWKHVNLSGTVSELKYLPATHSLLALNLEKNQNSYRLSSQNGTTLSELPMNTLVKYQRNNFRQTAGKFTEQGLVLVTPDAGDKQLFLDYLYWK